MHNYITIYDIIIQIAPLWDVWTWDERIEVGNGVGIAAQTIWMEWNAPICLWWIYDECVALIIPADVYLKWELFQLPRAFINSWATVRDENLT